MAELVTNVGFLVYSVLLIYLFIKRRSSVPKLMVLFYAANFGYILLDYLLVQAIGLPIASTSETVRSITTALVGAAIWIPYFNISKRVKATFVEQLQPITAEEAPQYEADERARIN